jgi:hypothetical protein
VDTPVVRRPAPGDRIGDADRERAAELLGDAAAAGYLRLDELDDRLALVWSATTGAELAAAGADLPDDLRRAQARRAAVLRGRDVARAGLVPHLMSYAAVMLLLVAIWLSAGVMGGGWYPWPIWPALGWGIGVASHVRAASGWAPSAH